MIISVLNYNREYVPDERLYSDNKFIFCSNRSTIDHPNVINIPVSKNVASSKNAIMDIARQHGDRYLFIIEDDVGVVDFSVFSRYIKEMEDNETPLMMYGYHKRNNRIMGTTPNPIVRVRVSDDREVWFNRFFSGSFIAIDLERITEKFDENLNIKELEELIQRLSNDDKLPYNGFFIDVPESYKYFTISDMEQVRIKTVDMVKRDDEYIFNMKVKYEHLSNVDVIINDLKKRYGG